MWANCSGRSPKMSDHERFAQVDQRKWAIVSKSLRSLTKNERMSESLIFLSELLICSFLGKKRVIRSENQRANSQPCMRGKIFFFFIKRTLKWIFFLQICIYIPSFYFREQSQKKFNLFINVGPQNGQICHWPGQKKKKFGVSPIFCF